ncbi:PIN-like domain-containing protein [Asanoa sp. NPDC049518]|uniref:PIN-like domain-containing protein n=1 Tax=unclassified Asanoa TaxID=2685164 RepID=UPI003438C01D
MSFTKQFEHYLPPPEVLVRQGMKTGMIVFDTNVLLALYRLASHARNELFLAMERVQERAWIPYQVGLEFHSRRLDVLFDHNVAYMAALAEIESSEAGVSGQLVERIQQLANRVLLPDEERDTLLRMVKTLFKPLGKRVVQLRDSHGITESDTQDPILERLQKIFDGRTGQRPNDLDLEASMAEAARRIKSKTPPGYKDAKPGDYLVWTQALSEAKSRRADVLVFVTGDVKEDWYLRVRGQTICARPELAEEAKTIAGSALVMLRTETFLRHSAVYLDAKVSDDTIRQASEAGEMDRVKEIARLLADLDQVTEAATHQRVLATRLRQREESVTREIWSYRAELRDLGVAEDKIESEKATRLHSLEAELVRIQSERLVVEQQRERFDHDRFMLDSILKKIHNP